MAVLSRTFRERWRGVSAVDERLVTRLLTKPSDDPEYNAVRIFDLLELVHSSDFTAGRRRPP